MSEEVYEWRKIWKEAIITCQETVRDNKQNGKYFEKLREYTTDWGEQPFKNDRMVDFEEGIAYECMKQYDKAIKLYEKVADEENGLPVKHWRKRANIFLQRALKKKAGCPMEKDIGEACKPEVQWNAFYFFIVFLIFQIMFYIWLYLQCPE